jgi:hypothetical protein
MRRTQIRRRVAIQNGPIASGHAPGLANQSGSPAATIRRGSQ